MNTSKTKVCHIASVDITVKFLLLPQLKFLINEGYDVSVVCSDGKWIKNIKEFGIKVKNIKIKRRMSPFSDLVSLFKMFLYFKKEKFDIVHVHTPKPGLLGQLAAKMAGVPVIINTIHGLYFADSSSIHQKSFFIFLEKIAARCSSLIFSQNKEDIKTIVNEKIAKIGKIEYLGNGVDIGRFNPENFSEEFIIKKKKSLGIKHDIKVIGIVGRLVKEKGYLKLFMAFRSVLDKNPETLLLIIGPEDLEKKDSFLPEIVKDYGIKENVMFLGERMDIEELYPLMDIFVLPSYREGFPRTIIEANVASRPVIATNIRGCREIIEDGKTGILVPPGDSEKIAEAIVYLLENPEKAKEIGRKGREKAMVEFNEEIIFGKIKKAYENLLPKKYLITGGAGFIGSSLSDALIKKGSQVVIVDKFLNKKLRDINSKAKIFKLDIGDPSVSDIFELERPDVVYHFAGPINLRRNANDPLFNEGLSIIDSSRKILDYCCRFKVNKIIFLSSGGAIYSNAENIPTSEQDIITPNSPYGLANLAIENLLKEYNKNYNLNYVILRLGNIYGPKQWESGIIPSFIINVLNNKSPTIIGDGTQTRDFIYIDDVISVLIDSTSYTKSSIFNIGSGTEITLNDLFKKITQILNKKVEVEYNFKEKEKTPRSFLDCRKIKKELGWAPKVTLEEGLIKTIRYFNGE